MWGYFEVAELSPLLSDLGNLGELVEDEMFAPSPEAAASDDAADAGDDDEQLQRIADYFT